MDRRHDNPPIDCRFLSDNDLPELHETFLAAFSDYQITFQLSFTQLERHIVLNAVDLNRSVGCFADGKMVAFTLNGFGDWKGQHTVYDAGTGVRPEFRRRGLSKKMFDLVFPMCREHSVEQCLLEVIVENEKALNLYKGLGYYANRTLLLLEIKSLVKSGRLPEDEIKIKDITSPDWHLLCSFWDGETSWQNSIEAIDRTLDHKKVLGAFLLTGECVGYVVFSGSMGRVAQMAVSRHHRNRGIGSKLLLEVQEAAREAESVQVINVDDSMTGAVGFLRNRGFNTILSQYEMVKNFDA